LEWFRGAPADWAGVRARDDGSEDRGFWSLRARPSKKARRAPGSGPSCCSGAARATRARQLRNGAPRLTGSAAARLSPAGTMAG